MKHIFLICSALVLLICGVSAQKEKVPTVEVSLYAFEHHRDHRTIFLKSPKNEPYEIALSRANILGPFKTMTDDKGRVTLRKKATNADGETIYPMLTRVTIPAGVKEPLLILIPIRGDSGYRSHVVDRSLASFPVGSYKIYNFSPTMIRGLVGKTQVNVSPKKLFAFNPSANVEDLMDVHFQYMNGEVWKTFGRTRWVKVNEKRTLLCVFEDPRTKRMKIRGVSMESIQPLRDRKKAKKPKQKAEN